MAKKRVGVLIRESIGGNKSSNKSTDLAALTQRYVEFTKRIRAMVDALKAQHACMIQMEESRLKVRPSRFLSTSIHWSFLIIIMLFRWHTTLLLKIRWHNNLLQ
jgi:hypothetical protein